MSYLAFDLDALKMVPDAARSAGIAEAELGYGLVRLWSYCWTAKTDTVRHAHLAGFFGGSADKVATALVAFEFLAPFEDSGFRVRGAERYLRVQKARSDGGKKASANLIPGGPQPRPALGSTSATAEPQPSTPLGSASALTPNTEQRAANTEHRDVVVPTTETPPVWVVKPPTTPPDTWTGEDFWRWAQGRRQAAKLAPEKMPHPRGLSTWWSEVRSHCDAEALKEAFMRFGADPHWEKATPPFPWAGFVHPDQLPKYLPPGAINATSV